MRSDINSIKRGKKAEGVKKAEGLGEGEESNIDG
jgi:hypothetical protein